VDRKGVQNILEALSLRPRRRKLKRVVFLSSVGVLRTKQIPYSILNAFGEGRIFILKWNDIKMPLCSG
jgi:hypothetical protein